MQNQPTALACARSVKSLRSTRGDGFCFYGSQPLPVRNPIEKRVTCGSTPLSECRMPRSCFVPTLRAETRSRAPVRRSAHSLSSCPSALDFVLDRRTWNGHNLRCFSIEQCSALPLVPRYTIWHSRGLTLSSSDLAPLRRKLLLPFLCALSSGSCEPAQTRRRVPCFPRLTAHYLTDPKRPVLLSSYL